MMPKELSVDENVRLSLIAMKKSAKVATRSKAAALAFIRSIDPQAGLSNRKSSANPISPAKSLRQTRKATRKQS